MCPGSVRGESTPTLTLMSSGAGRWLIAEDVGDEIYVLQACALHIVHSAKTRCSLFAPVEV